MRRTKVFASSMRKIKICHLTNYIGPAGKERGMLKLIANMNKDIFDITTIAFNQIRQFNGIINTKPFKMIELNTPGGNQWRLPFKLNKIFRRHDFDIVHTHSWGTLIEGILGAKMAQIPVIIHSEHGTFPEKWPHTVLQNIFWHLSDQVLSVSGELSKKLSRSTGFPEQKIKTILNGVESAHFFPDRHLRMTFRQDLEIPADAFVVGTIGRLHPVKNHPMLLKAIKELTDRKIDLHCVIAGGSSSKSQTEAIQGLSQDLGIMDRVHFLGFQKHINKILNGLDVFLLTSLSEGCSNVIQEAMFAQKAIIATRVGGNPELLQDGETGLLVESSQHIDLANQIARLKREPSFRKQLAEEARKYGQAHFSLSGMVEQYEALYFETFCNKFPDIHITALSDTQ